MAVTLYSYAVISIISSIPQSNYSKLIGSEADLFAQLICAPGTRGLLYVEVFAKRSGPSDGPTDGPTDLRTYGRTDSPSYRDARTHLKKQPFMFR